MLNVKTGTVLDRLLSGRKFYALEYFFKQVDVVKSSDESFFSKNDDMTRLYNNLYGYLYALKEMSVITEGELDTAVHYLIHYVKV